MKLINEPKQVLTMGLFLFVLCEGKAASLKTKGKIRELFPPGNCSAMEVRAHLASTAGIGDHIGIVKITLPKVEEPLSLCFPVDEKQHQQASILTHVLCRQIGYMTVDSNYIESHRVGDEQNSLVPTSPGCIGHEQSMSQCCWKEMTTKLCRHILGIRCHSCSKKHVASSGSISSPGYPNSYFYSVLCEWHILVSAKHTIELIFNYFHLPRNKRSAVCDSNSAYIEIVYQTKAGFTVKRYCNNVYAQNLSIPCKEARVRFFSGFYSGIYAEIGKNYGVSFSFKAKFNDSDSGQNLRSLIISCVFISVLVLLTSCYLCKKWKHSRKRKAEERMNAVGPNAPGLDALHAAYEFQRVRIQAPRKGLSVSESSTSPSDDLLKPSTYEVVAALAPVGPRQRIISSHGTTPRTIIPEILEMREKNHEAGDRSYLSRLKTKLLARFSTTTVQSSEESPQDISDCSVFLPPPPVPFEIYRSCSSENDDGPSQLKPELSSISSGKLTGNLKTSTSTAKYNMTYDIPSIVVQKNT